MKKSSLYLLLGIVLVVIILIFGVSLVDHSRIKESYIAKVVKIGYGNNIILSNDKVIRLAGVFILYKGSNYKQELIENIKDLLIGQTVSVKEILKYRGKGDGYPLYPLAEVYLEDDTMINAKLLEEGMAFFDYGHYKGKEKFEKLQKKAKINKRGIWGSKKPPIVVYVGSKKWRFVHYANCPDIKKIKGGERIDYYFLPPVIFGANYFAYDCKYRKKIENERGIDEATHDYMQP